MSMKFLLIEIKNLTHILFLPLQLCRECPGKADDLCFAEVVLPGIVTFTCQDENNEKLILLPLVEK